ncbi:hypothetical protein BCC1697_006270 [Burkholderia gladioli]
MASEAAPNLVRCELSVIEAMAGCAGSARTGCANVSPRWPVSARWSRDDRGASVRLQLVRPKRSVDSLSNQLRNCIVFDVGESAKASMKNKSVRVGAEKAGGTMPGSVADRGSRSGRSQALRISIRRFASCISIRFSAGNRAFRGGFARKPGSTPFARPACRFACSRSSSPRHLAWAGAQACSGVSNGCPAKWRAAFSRNSSMVRSRACGDVPATCGVSTTESSPTSSAGGSGSPS